MFTSKPLHFWPKQSSKARLRNLRSARPSPPSLHFGTKGLQRVSPLSQRGGCGRERAERPGNRTASQRRLHGRVEDTGGRGPAAGSGNPTAVASGRLQSRPQAGPARMRHATRSQGRGRDVNSEPRRRPRPRARACAPGPGPGGLALCPAPAAAAHRAGRRRLRPPLCLSPRGRPAPAAHTQAYLRAASSPLRAVGTARPGPRTADTWRLPLKRPGSAGRARVQPCGEEGAAGAGRESRGGEDSSRELGKGTKKRKGGGLRAAPLFSPVPRPETLAFLGTLCRTPVF